jgi:hypothetical protein
MNPTATSILDQAAQSYLDASYEAWKIDQQPLSRKISQIQRLPKSQQDAAIMEVVQEIGSTGDMKTLIYLALDGMKAAEQRNQAQSTYCQARAMAEQLGLKEAQNA